MLQAASGSDRLTRTFLRLEGAAVLFVSVYVYLMAGYDWIAFAVLFLVPDLSMVGYLRGPVTGAWCYNIVHSYVTAIAIAVVGEASGVGELTQVALILVAHIGFDRMLGYGLKSRQGFGFTHLGLIGKAAKGQAPEAAASTPSS